MSHDSRAAGPARVEVKYAANNQPDPNIALIDENNNAMAEIDRCIQHILLNKCETFIMEGDYTPLIIRRQYRAMQSHLIMKHAYSLPHWRPFRCFNTHSLTPSFRARLLDPGSTTKYQEKNQLSLKVLRHDWQLRPQLALVREVVLYCNNRAWMYARTIFPKQSLQGKGQIFRHLNDKPLGKILFSDPNLVRSEFELALLDERHHDYQIAGEYCRESVASLWARRSIFLFYGKPLLLTEVFLPHE